MELLSSLFGAEPSATEGNSQDQSSPGLLRWSFLIFCCVVSMILGGIIGYSAPRPPTKPIVVITPPPTPTPTPTPTPPPVRVYVCGAVRNPGVYRLPPGSLVDDVIRAAGGPTEDADLLNINLALELEDQQQVYVPHIGEISTPPPPVSSPPSSGSARININTASAAELQRLPYIGPTLAQRIVAYREAHGPFQQISDLMQVPGIGPAIFAAIRDLVTIGP